MGDKACQKSSCPCLGALCRHSLGTYRLLVLDVIWKLLLRDVGVGEQHLDDGAREPLHVPLPDLRVGRLQLGDDVEALRQLGKDVHHRVGEEGVLRTLLELCSERGTALVANNVCLRKLSIECGWKP